MNPFWFTLMLIFLTIAIGAQGGRRFFVQYLLVGGDGLLAIPGFQPFRLMKIRFGLVLGIGGHLGGAFITGFRFFGFLSCISCSAFASSSAHFVICCWDVSTTSRGGCALAGGPANGRTTIVRKTSFNETPWRFIALSSFWYRITKMEQ